MRYAVIGLGEFGTSVALGLAKRGGEVIAVDIKMERVTAVRDHVALAVRMDASEPGALAMHGIGDVDVLIAGISNNFEAQVLLVVHARQRGIPKIIARATTAEHILVLKAVGADEVFNPEEEAARWAVQRLLVRNITNYFELADGFSVVEVAIPETIVGKTIQQLDLQKKFRFNLLAIKRPPPATVPAGSPPVFDPVPDPEGRLPAGSALSLAGSVLNIANFLARFE